MKRKFNGRVSKRLPWILGTVLILAVISIVFLKFNPFLIKDIKLVMDRVPCIAGSNIDADLGFTGKNPFILNIEGQRKIELIKKYPCIKDIKSEYLFPDTAKVTLSGRTVLVNVSAIENPDFSTLDQLKESTPSSSAALLDWSFPKGDEKPIFAADETGFVFSSVPEASALTLYLSHQNLKPGEQLDGRLFESLKAVVPALGKLDGFLNNGRFPLIKSVGNSLLVKTDKEIVFSVKKDILRELASLQLILQKAKIDEREIKTIDLRFDKPVVVYGKRQSTVRN